jgi:hypothetical protein
MNIQDYIKGMSQFLTDDHVEALLTFTELRLTSSQGRIMVFSRQTEKETKTRPFSVAVYIEDKSRAISGLNNLRLMHGTEIVLLAESLLAKLPPKKVPQKVCTHNCSPGPNNPLSKTQLMENCEDCETHMVPVPR